MASFILFLAVAFAVFRTQAPFSQVKNGILFLGGKTSKSDSGALLKISRLTVDARSFKRWVYYNLSLQEPVHPRYVSSMNWDLAFKRYHIIANGGVKNIAGNGGILDLGQADFQHLLEAPRRGYCLDTLTRSKESVENRAIWHWYRYDYSTHVLTPLQHVYVVRTPEERYFAFKILSYYCPSGESGCLTFEYRPVRERMFKKPVLKGDLKNGNVPIL